MRWRNIGAAANPHSCIMQAVPRTAPAFAKANGIDLCYDTFGDPKAPPMLLIMGLASQMVAWDEEFCAGLAERGFYVVRFDNRDIGLSMKFPQLGTPNVQALFAQRLLGGTVTAPYTLADMAADAVGLLGALGIGSAHVVGLSMGGSIARVCAIAPPIEAPTTCAATIPSASIRPTASAAMSLSR